MFFVVNYILSKYYESHVIQLSSEFILNSLCIKHNHTKQLGLGMVFPWYFLSCIIQAWLTFPRFAPLEWRFGGVIWGTGAGYPPLTDTRAVELISTWGCCTGCYIYKQCWGTGAGYPPLTNTRAVVMGVQNVSNVVVVTWKKTFELYKILVVLIKICVILMYITI